MNAARSITELTQNCEDWDKDVRYMALDDIWKNLSRDGVNVNSVEEAGLVNAIMKTLKDKDTEVRSRAIKCVSVIVTKVSVQQISRICESLCGLMLSELKEDIPLRDQYQIALSTLIENSPNDESMNKIAESVNDALMTGITSENISIKHDCLKTLKIAIERFG